MLNNNINDYQNYMDNGPENFNDYLFVQSVKYILMEPWGQEGRIY